MVDNSSSLRLRVRKALHFNRHRHRSAPTKEKRRAPSAAAPAAQFIDQRGTHARAAGADGMAQCNRSTVHVYTRPIPVEFFAVCQGLRSEGFVDLDQVEIGEPEAGVL